MAAEKQTTIETFKEASNEAIHSILYGSQKQLLVLTGLTDDHSNFNATLQFEGSNLKSFRCHTESSVSHLKSPQTAMISFHIGDTRFLFKATIKVLDESIIQLDVISKFYSMQRRNHERLKIPVNYFNMVKVNTINGSPAKAFGNLINVSEKGFSILIKGTSPALQRGHTLKISITFKSRPMEQFDFFIRYVRILKGSDSGQVIGGFLIPEGSPTIQRRMKSLAMDVYRELMKSFD